MGGNSSLSASIAIISSSGIKRYVTHTSELALLNNPTINPLPFVSISFSVQSRKQGSIIKALERCLLSETGGSGWIMGHFVSKQHWETRVPSESLVSDFKISPSVFLKSQSGFDKHNEVKLNLSL
jgi:hypothetical protein